MKIAWFSTGVSSFVACRLTSDIDKILYTHIDDQHEDGLRFLADCEAALGREIEILQSEKYSCVADVLQDKRFINSAYGAPCTLHLKKRVRQMWEREYGIGHTYIWGYDVTEKHRADRLVEMMPEFNHEFPLIEKGLTKADCHGLLKSLGIKRPAMYDMGYPNNNCIGCVKGGMGYWNKIRVDFPDVFKRRAEMERAIGHSCIKDIFLDELDPDAGREQKVILEECGIVCEIAAAAGRNLSGYFQNGKDQREDDMTVCKSVVCDVCGYRQDFQDDLRVSFSNSDARSEGWEMGQQEKCKYCKARENKMRSKLSKDLED